MQTLKYAFLFGWVAFFSCAGSTPPVADKTNWLSLEEVTTALQKEKRPVLIDLYTDWCGWCKVMDKRTYSNKKVVAYLNEKYFAAKINAESRDAFTWKGKNYNFNTGYNTNEFALYLTSGQLSYPTTVIIPVDGDPQAIPGFLAPNEFEQVVKYFGEGHYKSVGFDQYLKKFKSTW